MNILCIGGSAYDITLLVDNYPTENQKIRLSDNVVECGGGSASNAAYLLSLWGVNTTIASVIGHDNYGRRIIEEYNTVGVNTKYLETRNIKTSTSYIIANKENGSRTILISRDKDLRFENITDINDKYDYIYTDGNFSDLAYNTILKNKDSISILDAGKVNEDTIKLCSIVDYIVCSSDFAKEYAKISFNYDDLNTIKDVYDAIQKDVKGLLIITLESNGSFVKINDEYKLIPSIIVNQVDSTGAGDIYHAAFVYFLSQGYNLEEAIKLANTTGGISVTRVGGRNSIPTLEEVINYDK